MPRYWERLTAWRRPETVDFFTAPTLGTGMEGTASVVYLDEVAGDRMWAYLRTDSLWANADEFSGQALPDPRSSSSSPATCGACGTGSARPGIPASA
jgi:hypothetical protein